MLLGILFAVSCLLPTGKSEFPILNVTEKYIDAPLGSTLYLKCSGEYPLAWKFRYPLKEKESPLEAFTTSKAALFESIIRLEFYNHAATGRYICLYRNASRTDSTSIYVFVNSAENLLLPVDGYPFKIILMEEREVTTIPCLPSYSAAEVSLQKSVVSAKESTVSAIDLNSEVDFCDKAVGLKENIPYDPTEGFKISNSTSYYRGPFCCEAAMGELKEKIVFIFAVRSSKINVFTAPNVLGYPVVNSVFSIDCFLLKGRGTSLSRFYYGWSYPMAAANKIIIDEVPMMNYEIMYLDHIRDNWSPVRLKTFTIHSSEKTDEGFYRCVAMTPLYEVDITEHFIPVYDVQGYPYLVADGASVEFKADYRTLLPSMVPYWQTNGRLVREIPGKYEMFQNDDAYILRIQNVSKNDSELYYFYSQTTGLSTLTYFRLSVFPATPEILAGRMYGFGLKDLKKETIYCKGSTVTMWVRLEWLWRPFCDNACDESVRFEVIWKENISIPEEMLQYVGNRGIMLTVKNIRGKYLCRGTDEYGSAEKPAFISNGSENVRPRNFPPLLRVNQLDRISLSCAANKSLYNNIEIRWRRSDHDSFEPVNRSVVYSENEDELKANYPFEMIVYEQTGTYRCSTSYRGNSSRTNEKSIFIFVTGPGHRFIYFTNMDIDDVVRYVNETVELFCYVSGEYPDRGSEGYSVMISWYFNDTFLEDNTFGITYADGHQKLIINHVSTENTGYYQFQVKTLNRTGLGNAESRRIRLLVKTSPIIWKTNMNSSTVSLKLRESVDLLCYVEDLWGINITWYHQNNSILDTSIPGVKFDDHFQKLQIEGMTEENGGVYECRVENKLGFASARITLRITKTPGQSDISRTVGFTVLGAVLFVIFSAFMTLILLRRYRRHKNDEGKELSADDETTSEEDDFNYEVSPEDMILTNQVLPDVREELGLEYDKKLEFPKDRLKFGKSLGRGEFGSVVKAKAIGIHDFEPSTVVAVKMAKDRGNPVHEAALKKELKILILLGYHLNIVNLLGAVTRSPKGLMLIVEYCRHGNLRDFLRKHKNRFLPQETELSENSEEEKQLKVFTESTELEDHGEHSVPQSPSSLDTAAFAQQNATGKLENTTFDKRPCGNSTVHGSGNAAAAAAKCPKRRRGIRLSASDLISYAFQCARGMSYLASKKLIHRDLAARNILLAKGNVIKICDYGLTKDIYNYPNYIHRKDVPLPFKWMAIESLGDRVFTTKSDVWSFGVVLWELFTLGKNPYPTIPADEHFYSILKGGYRMEKPELATEDIYQMMRNCWRENPGERPYFSELTKLLGDLLQDRVRQRYIKLNEPYAKRNEESALLHLQRTEQNEPPENFTDVKNPTTVQDHRDDLGTTPHNSGDAKTPSEAKPQDKLLCSSQESCFPQIEYLEEIADTAC